MLTLALALALALAASPDAIGEVLGNQLGSPLPESDPLVRQALAQARMTGSRIQLMVGMAPTATTTPTYTPWNGLSVTVSGRQFWMDELAAVNLIAVKMDGDKPSYDGNSVVNHLTSVFGEPTYYSSSRSAVWMGEQVYISSGVGITPTVTIGSVAKLRECEHWLGLQCQTGVMLRTMENKVP